MDDLVPDMEDMVADTLDTDMDVRNIGSQLQELYETEQ